MQVEAHPRPQFFEQPAAPSANFTVNIVLSIDTRYPPPADEIIRQPDANASRGHRLLRI